ncbi:MAG TPA: hypothetical protein VIC28_11775, partial [Thermoanaerobaculia bacterium]
MTRARIFRLAASLVLAFLAVGLGGLSVYRKVQAFQPLGFEAVPRGGILEVAAVDPGQQGLRKGDLILEDSSLDQLARRLKERPASQLLVQRGEQVLPVSYQRPPLDVDYPYLILCLIGAVYLGIGLFTLLRHGGGQSLLFYLWCLTSAALYLLTPTPPVDPGFVAITIFDAVAYILLPALTVHLFLTFPSPLWESRRLRRLVPFLYLPAAALLALQLDLMLAKGHWIFGSLTAARIQALDRIELFHFVAFAVAALALLAWRFRRGAAWEQQRQTQWI